MITNATASASATRTNDEWLAELRRSSAEALEDLRAYLRKALARVLRNRAHVGEHDLDDFTQDALLRVLQGLDRFRGDSRFTTWATAVAVRAALTVLRRRRHHQPLEDLDQGTSEPLEDDPGRDMDRRTLLEALHRAIEGALTERQRIAILGELAGVPSEVLVERLGTNPNALYKLHHDARKKLKRALEDAGFRDEDVRRELLAASQEG